MKKLKHGFVLLLALIMIISLCSCGLNTTTTESGSTVQKDTTKEESNNTQKDKIEIRFAWWGDTKRHEVYNTICDRFEEANPDIKVIRESGSWADYWDKLATQSAGSNAPDVFGMHPQYVSDYAERGALLDLKPFTDSGAIDLSKFSDSVIQSGKVGDLLCMISQGVTFTNNGGNQTLADKYGIKIPAYNEDWTWSDFGKTAKEFTDMVKSAGEKDLYFSNDYSGQYNTFRYMVRQTGADLYTEDGQLGFDAEVVEKWFTFWKDLRDYGAVPDGATTTEDGAKPLEQKLFTLGKTIISSYPANQLHLYQTQMPDSNIVLVRNPTGDDGRRGEYIEGAHFAVSSAIDTAHQEAGAKLIDFFVNTKESLELFKMEQGVPGNSEMAEYIKPLLDDVMSKEIDFVNETMEVASEGTYAPKGATEIDTAFKDAASMVQFDEADPKKAAETFIEAAKAVIGKN